jgi:hypothetical protein
MTINKYELLEISLDGPLCGNPYTEVQIRAELSQGNRLLYVDGFYDGNGVYKLRFMPDTVGLWRYTVYSNAPELNGSSGSFECLPAASGVHGPVRVRGKYHFSYDDGTPYLPVGTTCYAWNHQKAALRQKTLETLKAAPFNKLRMCVFPKHYDYNLSSPEVYPYVGSEETGFDFTRFEPRGWAVLEECIRSLMKLGIEADIILFHPYDRWGFAAMDAQACGRYLKYAVARLSAYRNVWWSFANEFDLMQGKTEADWDGYFQTVQAFDPYQHLRSVHNCLAFYDHNKPWVTHCSIQSSDMEKAVLWRKQYNKPIVVDECCYEGDIHLNWGNISAEEMTERFWEGFVRGAYVGHGETYLNDREELWWSKGGELVGGSHVRIAFYKTLLEQAPTGFAPLERDWGELPIMGVEGQYYLHYTGTRQPKFRKFNLPQSGQFTIDIVDTWNMTTERLPGTFSGPVRVPMPGRKYMAIIMKKS